MQKGRRNSGEGGLEHQLWDSWRAESSFIIVDPAPPSLLAWHGWMEDFVTNGIFSLNCQA